MKNSIIYCRVSTKEQAELGYSLDIQEKACIEYAKRCGYEVIRQFREEGESAKTIDRTQLKLLLDFISSNPSKAKVVIVYKLDRLARNMVDYTALITLFSKFGIDVESVTEQADDSPAGKLTKNMIAAIAQFDNDQRRERTVGGMKEAVLEGRWCWMAPTGYTNSLDEHHRPIIIPNEECKFVIEAYRMAEMGIYTKTEIAETLHQKGFIKLSKNLIYRILTNPLYAGIIKISWFPQEIEGIHKPLISKDTFYSVQSLLKGPQLDFAPKGDIGSHFPLKTTFKCPKCKCNLTGSYSRGKLGKLYPYYHCRTKGCSYRIRKEELEKMFMEFLDKNEPNDTLFELYEDLANKTHNKSHNMTNLTIVKIKKQITVLEEKKKKILELLMSGTIDPDTYKTLYSDTIEKIYNLKNDTKIVVDDTFDLNGCLNFIRGILKNCSKLWNNAQPSIKTAIQRLILPEGASYGESGLRTHKTLLLFNRIQLKKFYQKHVVAPRGIEPLFAA